MTHDRHEWFLNQIFRHRKALQSRLRRLGVPPDDIEDLTQESYLRIYGVKDYTQVESPKALLFSIAHNLAVERVRRTTRQATDSVGDFEAIGVISSAPSPDDDLDTRRRFEALAAAVDELPPVCRRVFVLRKVYRLSHKELTDVLGIAPSTIEKHVAKGLKRCRDYLQEQGLGDWPKGQSPSARKEGSS